jgi:hypothetical protein
MIQKKVITTTQTSFVKPKPFPKSKSASPPPSNSSLVQKTLRIAMNNSLNNGINSFDEEPDTASSPLPNSNEFSLLSENENLERPKSVQKVNRNRNRKSLLLLFILRYVSSSINRTILMFINLCNQNIIFNRHTIRLRLV